MNPVKIFGLHSVQAALAYSPDKIYRVWIDSHRSDRRLQKIIDALADLDIDLQYCDKKKLDHMVAGNNHQGIVIETEMPKTRDEHALKEAVANLTEDAFFLVLDHVQDPHNLGACLRTADAVGVHGVIITKDQATGITPTVCKVACGAAETVPVYQVTNLSRTLRWLRSEQIWVVGSAGEAQQTIYQSDLVMSIALVVGAEEKGLRRLTREQCDLLVKIPMSGTVDSLNLSVATGILLYETFRQRQIL